METNSLISITPSSAASSLNQSKRKSAQSRDVTFDASSYTPITNTSPMGEIPVTANLTVSSKKASTSGKNSRRISFASPIMDNSNTPNSNQSFGNNDNTGNDNTSLNANSTVLSTGRKSSSRSSLNNSILTQVSTISTPGSAEFTRGHIATDETYLDENNSDIVTSDEEEDIMNDSGFTTNDSLVASAMKRKVQRLNDSEEDTDEEYGSARRSRRQTKGKRFQFWKNERVVYDKVCLYLYI